MTRRAGTARRPSTSSPCTAWRPTPTCGTSAAGSCQDSDLANADAAIVDTGLASIVSNSYGEPASYSTINATWDLIFQVGALEGIGFMFSSGDSGYEGPGEDPISAQDQVDYPTSSPYVTSVGGTSVAISSTKSYQWETSWGTMLDPLKHLKNGGKKWQYTPPGKYPAWYDGSGGGGVSTEYSQPSYQAGVVPNSLATKLPNGTTSSTPMRVIPDVSALADPSTGILVGQTTLQPNGKTYAFSLSRIGGTSVACPVFAGIEADAQQAAGGSLGFANPAIYYLDTHFAYGSSNAAYNDVTDHPLGPGYLAEVRNNYTNPYTKQGPLLTYLRTLGINGEGADALRAVTGYDDATGVGSPKNYIHGCALAAVASGDQHHGGDGPHQGRPLWRSRRQPGRCWSSLRKKERGGRRGAQAGRLSCSARRSPRPRPRRTRRPAARPAPPGFSSYSCVPTVSRTCTASMLPSWAARSSGRPQATAARKPDRNASPVPVGSTFRTSGTAATKTGIGAGPLDLGAGGPEGGHPDADPVQDFRARTTSSCAR